MAGARVPPVLVAEPCGVAPELGASPPWAHRGAGGARSLPGLMAGKEPLLSALRGENNPGGSSVWGLSRGSPKQGVSCLALHHPLFALAAPTPRYKEVFWSFCPLPGWVSPCSHPGHLPRCLPRAVRSPSSPPSA